MVDVPKEESKLSEVVLQATKDKESKTSSSSSFKERLKKVRQTRTTRRNLTESIASASSPDTSPPTSLVDISRSLSSLPPPILPPLTLPTVEEDTPDGDESFGIFSGEHDEGKQEKEREDSVRLDETVTVKDGILVSIIGDHLYEIPQPPPPHADSTASPTPPKTTPTPTPHLATPPKTPPISPDALDLPPTLPNSPPPPPPPLSPDESLSPLVVPGDLQFTASDDVFLEGTLPLVSMDTQPAETPPTGRESPEHSFDEINRRRSVLSTTSAQDLHFKPSLKKWGVVTLNELNGTPPSSYEGEYPVGGGGSHFHSNSALSRISGGGIEVSLESIVEHTDPNLPPQLVQEKLTSDNLQEGDIDIREVGKTSWISRNAPVLPATINKGDNDDEFKTVSACQLTTIETKKKKEATPTVEDTASSSGTEPLVGVLSKEEKREKELKEKERQKHLLEMEGEGEEEEEEEEGKRGREGKKQKKGNLERLNQGIPLSTSSLFDSVVSDIPVLNEEKEKGGEQQKEKEGMVKEPLHVYELVQHNEADNYELVQPQPPPTPVRSSTSMSPPVSPNSVSPPVSPFSLSPSVSPPAGGGGAKKDGRQSMLKLYMHSVHPSVMYKMFRVSEDTTCADLVLMALKKTNLIEDHRSYSIYNIHDTNKANIQSVQEGDHVLPFLIKSKPGTHWEMRRKTDTKTVKVNIDVVGVSVESLSLLISPQATTQEVTQLVKRKLGLSIEQGKDNPYRILLVSDSETDERLMGADSPLLYSRSSSSSSNQFKMVDIVQYLTKDSTTGGPTVMTAPPKPKDFETAKIMLQQAHDRLSSLEKELIVKGYTIEQIERNFQETRNQNDTLHLQHEVMQNDIKTYEEKNKVLSQTVEELHETVSQLTSENKEISTELTFLRKENERMKEEHQKDETTIAKLHQAMNEVTYTSKEKIDSLNGDNVLLEEEREKLLKQIEEFKSLPSGNSASSSSTRSLYSLMSGHVQSLFVSIQLTRTPEGLGIMLINDPSGRGCIIKTVMETSMASGTLLPNDRLLEINGEDVSSLTHKDVLNVLEGKSNVQIVVSREMQEVKEAVSESRDIEQLKEECSRLTAKLSEANSLLNENELLLQEREEEIERTKSQLLPSKDIDTLKKELLERQTFVDKSESLADTLKDATREELLDALRTVEADCIKNKESLDRLFALIVGHTPELLSVMAEVQQPDGDDSEHDSDFGDEGHASPPPPPFKTGGWC